MAGEPKFGSQTCPIEVENEEEESNGGLWSVGHKKKKALLRTSPPFSTDITMMDAIPRPALTGLEIVPFNNPSPPHEPSASRNSANPKVTAPVSPSIEDLVNPRVAESGNHSPGDPENPGSSGGQWALDDATHGDTLPEASRGFKRLTKGHGDSVQVKMEHKSGIEAGSSHKTELQREMELYEAAEREEEAHLLTSLRHHQNGDCSPSSKSPHSMESIQADWNLVSGGTSEEQPRVKREREAGISSQESRKEEDVCFACFDGGDLILCDKRSCPKAYHMECTGRESEFFRKKGQWFCGWHVCAHCSRSAAVHCYTCPNAYCNGCVVDADFLYLRKDRGLCEQCYRIVYMIENNLSIDSEGEEVNFDDEETYECLFKDYWKDIKKKLSLSWLEITKAYNAKDQGEPHGKCVGMEWMTDDESSTDSDGRPSKRQSKRLKRKRGLKNVVVDYPSSSDVEEEEHEEEEEVEVEEEHEEESRAKPRRGRQKKREFIGWASKDLLSFLHFLNEDVEKPLSLLLLSKLVLSYVQANKLSNPRVRGRIRCDGRLQGLFGKKHAGKFEIMKLLKQHVSERVINAANFDNADEKVHKQRKSRKKLDDTRLVKSDPSKYAAVDSHNISLIYLKRSLLEYLQKDSNFESKVKGAFVRIRVPSVVNKNDTCYRLVQVVGVKQTLNPRSDVKMANVLEILNLQKREEITVDLISGQDFTEEECQRLRQSMKCGLLNAMTVGELQEKARILRDAKVKDWFNTELLRLSHLRDRASEKGLKKDLRECVERLELLNSSSERERRLRAPIEVNGDPRMDPAYESDNAGNKNPWDTGLGKKQSDQGISGWTEAGPHSERWEAKSKVSGLGGQKETSRDNFHSGKPIQQDWTATANEKNMWAGDSRLGLPDDAAPTDHHATSLNCRGSFSQKHPSDHTTIEINAQKSFNQKKVDGCAGTINDDEWGGNFEGDQQDNGWGETVVDIKQSNQQDFGWGEKGDGFKNNVKLEVGNTTGEKWAGKAADTTKTDGWGADEGFKKDNGWNSNVEGHGRPARNQNKENGGVDEGDGLKGHCRGHSLETINNDGWGHGGADGQKQEGWGPNAGFNSHNYGLVHSGGDARKQGGWGHSAGVESHNNGLGHPGGRKGKDDGWGHPGVSKGKDDGWGHTVGSSGEDDGWGKPAGSESEGGWGNFAGKNEKHVTRGVEAGGIEAKTGREWGNKTGGNRSESGWSAGFNRTEGKTRAEAGSSRDEGFVWREGKPTADAGSWKDTGFDRREGNPGVNRGPPYREVGGFSRGTQAHTRTSVPDIMARTGVNGVGVATENEREKIWYYQDPSKTTQGPFSMEQLRKWEKTKLFPLNLRIWQVTESQDASILLTDALQGRYRNDLPPGFDHPGRGARDDVRNAHGSGDCRRGSNWQDKGGKPPFMCKDWVPERPRASVDGEGVRPKRAWLSQKPDKHSPRSDGSRGRWDWESNHRNPSDHHHYSSRPGNDGRSIVKKRGLPCRYFAQGMCRKGDECDFMH